MLKIYTCENNLTMHHIRNVMENSGIQCLVKNESLQSTAGEIPPFIAWPELWIQDKNQESKAKQLLAELTQESQIQLLDWQCGECGEVMEGQFKICWNCSDASPVDVLEA